MGRTAIVDAGQNQKIEEWIYQGRSTAWIYEELVIAGYAGTRRTVESRISESKTHLRAQIIRETQERNPSYSSALSVAIYAPHLLTKEEKMDPEIVAFMAPLGDEQPKPVKRVELPPLVMP
jgi:hypothetical protein